MTYAFPLFYPSQKALETLPGATIGNRAIMQGEPARMHSRNLTDIVFFSCGSNSTYFITCRGYVLLTKGYLQRL